MNEKIYTVKEVASYLKCSERTVLNALRSGTLEGIKLGGHWRVKETAIKTFLNGK